jgi:hypothetical protein
MAHDFLGGGAGGGSFGAETSPCAGLLLDAEAGPLDAAGAALVAGAALTTGAVLDAAAPLGAALGSTMADGAGPSLLCASPS